MSEWHFWRLVVSWLTKYSIVAEKFHFRSLDLVCLHLVDQQIINLLPKLWALARRSVDQPTYTPNENICMLAK